VSMNRTAPGRKAATQVALGLAETRHDLNLSARDLAVLADLGETTVRRAEQGRASPAAIVRIRLALIAVELMQDGRVEEGLEEFKSLWNLPPLPGELEEVAS
jgi:hypothetical protein